MRRNAPAEFGHLRRRPLRRSPLRRSAWGLSMNNVRIALPRVVAACAAAPLLAGSVAATAAAQDEASTAAPASTAVPASSATPASTAVPASSATPAVPSVSAGGQRAQPTSGRKVIARRAARRRAKAPAAPATSAPPVPELAAPISVPSVLIDRFGIPPFLLPIYQAAGVQYGVRWEVLAAVNEIETDYGHNLNVSTAGAVGWMQFMPSTWKRYGLDANHDGEKDPYNPVDAIFAAARYLKAAGAGQDIRRAIFAYNHADWYVESVLLRARLIAGLPADLVGSLTGLAEGVTPVDGKLRYGGTGHAGHRGLFIYARAGADVVATQDGRIVRIGRSPRLGRFVQLRDVYGNTYTYAHLGRLAGRRAATATETTKTRLFAHPGRAAAVRHGGAQQLGHGASHHRPLRRGALVGAGDVIAHVAPSSGRSASHLLFEIRPAGRWQARIDPEPLVDGWRLLARAGGMRGDVSAGRVLLMSKRILRARVLADRRIAIYACGRDDIRAGRIDRRVLATLEFLSAAGLRPTVSALECGHSVFTKTGNISEHSTGTAVDISAINGIPILGHQGAGSITDTTIRRLLALQGTMKPHQIISLMTYDGADNTISLPDHADHIHIGFRARPARRSVAGAVLGPHQWQRLVRRLGRIGAVRVRQDG
jgi:soluble lytic murein transglycosylase-like protein